MWILSLLTLAAMIFAAVDIATRDDSQIRHMPKALWIVLVILLPLVGIVLWFTIGRERSDRVSRPRRTMAAAPVQTPAPPSVPARDTRTTEQQLADLEREIEEDRLRAETARRRAERGDGGA